MQIFEKRLTEIHPYEKNPRKNDRAVQYVANSIKEFGFKVPIVIDKDGVLCKEDSKPYSEKEPIPVNIAKINRMTCYKVLYTARLESDRETTEQWLRKYGVKYNSLLMNKLPFTLLIDDKTSTK